MTKPKAAQKMSFRAVSPPSDANAMIAPGVDGNVIAHIYETPRDRLAGTTVTEEIWRDKPNHNVIVRRVNFAGVRSKCATFFLSRAVSKIIEENTPVHTLKAGDIIYLQHKLFNSISRQCGDTNVSIIVMEIVNSYLRQAGMVVINGEFTSEAYYPLQPVTVSALANDVAMQEVVRVLDAITTKTLPKAKFTAETFAAHVAEALVPVGKAFLDINELGIVVDDIVSAITANLTNGLTTKFNGHVPAWWRDHAVVQELSHNYVFVRAALAKPYDSSLSPISEGFKLDQWASIILAALKSSRRYALVKGAEARRDMTKRTIRDLKGRARSYAMYRVAKPAPVAQCVYHFDDVTLTSAVTVIPLKERIDQSIASAYNGGGGLGTEFIMDRFTSMLRDAIEGGYVGNSIGYHLDVGSYGEVSDHEIACLSADRIIVVPDAGGTSMSSAADSEEAVLNWWFVMQTAERDVVWSVPGHVNGSEFITNSVSAAMLVTPDFEASGPMDARPQLIAPAAFNTRIIDFNAAEALCPIDSRYTYDVTFGSSRLTGTLRAQDMGSLRAADGASIVKPRFNIEVFDAVAEVFATMAAEVANMRKQTEGAVDSPVDAMPATLIDFLDRQRGSALLQYAQQLTPAFRAEVHQSISRRSAMGKPRDEAIALTARLSQRQFGAYADVTALLVFLHMQGADVEWGTALLSEPEMIRTFLEHGTDRPALNA
jgi:hypothetical protein